MIARLLLLGAAAAALPAHALAAPPAIKVDTVRTAEDCQALLFWGPWLVSECRDQFPGMRTSLQSALLESDRIRLSTASGGKDVVRASMIVSASVSGLGSSMSRASAADYCVAGTRVKAVMDYRVRNGATGAVLYGGSVTKSVEVAHHAVAGSSHCSTYEPSRDDYRQLQTELALAAARAIVFRFEPLRVASLDGDGTILNYGAPYVKLGAAVDVTSDSGVPVRFRVTNAGANSAVARPAGTFRPVSPRAIAQLIEDDEPADNARRFERVELP